MRHRGAVNADDLLENVVLFDVPFNADELCEFLQAHRLAWLHSDAGRHRVAAALRNEPGDLATLLRGAETWAARACISRLAFEVDGRAYTLRIRSAAFAIAH